MVEHKSFIVIVEIFRKTLEYFRINFLKWLVIEELSVDLRIDLNLVNSAVNNFLDKIVVVKL